MVFNKDVLFIHIGKTGGTSVTNYLVKNLEKPVYRVVPAKLMNSRIKDEIMLLGKKHSTLAEAIPFLNERNIDYKDFQKILAVIRNPYQLEVSLFNYYKKLIKERPKYFDTAPIRKKLILRNSFPDFVNENILHRNNLKLKDYILVNKKIPVNLSIIKFESLSDSTTRETKKFRVSDIDFPHLNKSKSTPLEEIYTKELEEKIYNKYSWIFDNHFYPRLNFNK